MIKILIEDDENGNRMKVLEHNDGARTVDVLIAVSSPLMKLILDICGHDRQGSIDMLTSLLDSYIKANGDKNSTKQG